jgi:hypothetical protein
MKIAGIGGLPGTQGGTVPSHDWNSPSEEGVPVSTIFPPADSFEMVQNWRCSSTANTKGFIVELAQRAKESYFRAVHPLANRPGLHFVSGIWHQQFAADSACAPPSHNTI